MTETGPEHTEGDQPSRLKRYEKAIEDWFKGIQDDVERATPEMLEELAKEAKGIGQRLDDMAANARRKREQKEGAPERAKQPDSEAQEVAKPSTGE